MKVFDIALLDVTIITLPILVYLIYIAYTKTLNKDENTLVFIVVIFTQFYFIIRYGASPYEIPLIMINIPLILSYTKKSKTLILISSVITILYYYNFLNNYLIFLIIEYLIYYALFIKIKKRNIYLLLYSILKIISTIFLTKTHISEIMIEGILFYVLVVFTMYLLEQTEGILKLHKNIKEIENDKQIKTSLFRITHEIKNPIAVCKGYLDMYDENKIDDFKRYIPILKEEIDRTLILLEDFLSMNNLKINKELLDINLLLEEVTNNMEMLFKNNDINTDFDIEDDEIFINGDYNRLTQVFINIFKNSIESLENKKYKNIKLWTKTENDKINIYIKDNGIGMNSKTLNKIKEPFYTTKMKGTGLGVSLSNEIINAHNGQLEYESIEGENTTVTITLPLEKAI